MVHGAVRAASCRELIEDIAQLPEIEPFLTVHYGGIQPLYKRVTLNAAKRRGYRVEIFAEVCIAHVYRRAREDAGSAVSCNLSPPPVRGERRLEARHALMLLVQLGEHEWVVTHDLSFEGMYVQSAGAHQIGERLALEVLFKVAPITFRANARVVRLTRSGATMELALRLSDQQLIPADSALHVAVSD